jgi:uncharacterized protein (DUF58 family)
VLVAGVGSLVAAVSLGTTQFYQLSYTLFGLCAAALVLGLAGSRALGLERRLSSTEGITAGGSTTVGLRLTNGSRLALSGVEIVDRLPHRQVFRPSAVPSGGERLVERTVSFPRRGLYGIGPAQVASTDPFGLLRFRRGAGLAEEVLVYPEVHELRGLPVHGGEEAGGRINPASRGEEFSGLREYRPGDDRRFIHWKSVARTGEIVVKEFDPDTPHRYSVVLDLRALRAASDGRELEDAVSAAASVVSYLDGAGLTYRLRLTDRSASSTAFGSAGTGHYHSAMRLLAAAEADGSVDSAEALLAEAGEGGLGETVILIQREAPAPGLPDSGAAGRSQEDQDALVHALREISYQGIAAVVILLASHTYMPRNGDNLQDSRTRQMRLDGLTEKMRASGAAVRVVRRESGAAGLSETRERENV